jgi:hypothetical protein
VDARIGYQMLLVGNGEVRAVADAPLAGHTLDVGRVEVRVKVNYLWA